MFFYIQSAKYLLCSLFSEIKIYCLVVGIIHIYVKPMISQRFIVLGSDPAQLKLNRRFNIAFMTTG